MWCSSQARSACGVVLFHDSEELSSARRSFSLLLQVKAALSFHTLSSLASPKSPMRSLGREDLRLLLTTTLHENNIRLEGPQLSNILDNTLRMGDFDHDGRLDYQEYLGMVRMPDNSRFFSRWFTVNMSQVVSFHRAQQGQ